MACFPLRKRPLVSYREPPRRFGDSRQKGERKHAGVDLYAPAGTEILAIEDGVVTRGAYAFYAGTQAIEIRHASGIVVRYCEIAGGTPVKLYDKVKEGQVIGQVGRLTGITVGSDMLHLEVYSGELTGPLTDFKSIPYERRRDLIDPTDYLDALTLFSSQPVIEENLI